MVLVDVCALDYDEPRGEAILDISVSGFLPRGPAEAMDFITKWASTLSINYLERRDPLAAWGHLLDELARGKIFIKTIPYRSSYSWDGGECRAGCADVFIDEGSPVRHIYIVERAEELAGVRARYMITGLGIAYRHVISILADFASADGADPPEGGGGVIRTRPCRGASALDRELVRALVRESRRSRVSVVRGGSSRGGRVPILQE